MSTFTDEIFGMVCYTVSSKHNPREGVFCYETRENLEIHVLFRGAGADFVRCASRAHRCRAARRVQKAAVLQPVRNVWPVSVLSDSRGAAAVCRMAVDCGGCEEKANRVHNGACGVSLCVFGAWDIRTIMQRSTGVRRYPHRKNINCCTKKDFSTI